MTDQDEHAPAKGEEAFRVPFAWRQPLSGIVRAFVDGDFQVNNSVSSVAPIPSVTASRIRQYVSDYGGTLIQLPEETWETSIAQWTGCGWDVLVDLWTREEGRTDMVLHVNVAESQGGYNFAVHLVYVP